MKKQNLTSLSLKKNTISNFNKVEEIKGGISGTACVPSRNCHYTVVHTCNNSDLRTCTLSYVQCND
jgi:hypothetical protein